MAILKQAWCATIAYHAVFFDPAPDLKSLYVQKIHVVPENPADIAKETIRQLASQRIAPTPEAYTRLYNEIAGNEADAGAAASSGGNSAAESLLASFADSMLRSKGELSTFGNRLVRAAQAGNWEDYQKTLDRLTEHLTTAPAAAAPVLSAPVVAAPAVVTPAPLLWSAMTTVSGC
jgi:hypothetical protein